MVLWNGFRAKSKRIIQFETAKCQFNERFFRIEQSDKQTMNTTAGEQWYWWHCDTDGLIGDNFGMLVTKLDVHI